MFEDEGYNTVTFSHSKVENNVTAMVSRTVNDAESYTDIVEEFRWFIQNIGFSYIGGITVLDEHGDEIYRTDV